MFKVTRPLVAAVLTLALSAGSALITTGTDVQAQEFYYPNCDAARAAGAAPIHRGEPGYRARLDRDNDGVACE